MITQRIAHQKLSLLCERVGVSFDVGLDPHRVFERESKNSQGDYSRAMEGIARHVKQGGALAAAIKAQGEYFPSYFADMIEAGEESGRLEQVLERLSEYYGDLAEMRSTFWGSIAWPMVQLVLGVVIVGLAIYLPEFLNSNPDEQIDMLGVGLVGSRGLMIYAGLVAIAVAAVVVLAYLARRDYFRFVRDAFARAPRVGAMVRVFPETRFIESLSLGIYSGVNAVKAIDMAFRSAGASQFSAKSQASKQAILQGREMHQVLEETGLFFDDTVEAVQLGEASGRLAETLDKHLRLLRTRVKHAMVVLTNLASSAIWVTISAVLIAIIFRIFSMYVNTLSAGIEQAF